MKGREREKWIKMNVIGKGKKERNERREERRDNKGVIREKEGKKMQ